MRAAAWLADYAHFSDDGGGENVDPDHSWGRSSAGPLTGRLQAAPTYAALATIRVPPTAIHSARPTAAAMTAAIATKVASGMIGPPGSTKGRPSSRTSRRCSVQAASATPTYTSRLARFVRIARRSIDPDTPSPRATTA